MMCAVLLHYCCLIPIRPFKLLYPVLMLVMVWHFVRVRLGSDQLIVFKPKAPKNIPGGEPSRQNNRISSTCVEGWRNSGSLFACANKGHWETVETTDKSTRKEANWFRIGFEPLYVDFTQSGAWFVVVILAEVSGVGYGNGGLLGAGIPR